MLGGGRWGLSLSRGLALEMTKKRPALMKADTVAWKSPSLMPCKQNLVAQSCELGDDEKEARADEGRHRGLEAPQLDALQAINESSTSTSTVRAQRCVSSSSVDTADVKARRRPS